MDLVEVSKEPKYPKVLTESAKSHLGSSDRESQKSLLHRPKPGSHRGKVVSHRARDCFGSLAPEARKHLSHCDPLGPTNPKTIKVTKKWLKSDFWGSPQSNPESDSKVTFRSFLSHFRVTLVTFESLSGLLCGDPQKSLLSHFFVTLIVLGFGGFCGAKRVTTFAPSLSTFGHLGCSDGCTRQSESQS